MSEFAGINVPAVLGSLGIPYEDRGREALARCPNHGAHSRGDTRPSWRIVIEPGDPLLGVHNCYPCGFSGNVVTLIAFVRGVKFREAADWLGLRTAGPGADAPEGSDWISWGEHHGGESGGSSLGSGHELVLPDGCRQVVSDDSWPEFAALYWRLKVGIPSTQAPSYGVSWGAGGRLRNRIVFPAWTGGRLLSYSARLVDFRGVLRELWPRVSWPDDDAEPLAWIHGLDGTPGKVRRVVGHWLRSLESWPRGIRYLTPRERDHSTKDWLRAEPGAVTRRALYGWDHVFPPDAPVITLVEGAIKAVRLHAAGWPNPVAIFGVGLTPERQALLRGCSRVYYPGDPDPAGNRLGKLLQETVGGRLTEIIPIRLRDPIDRIPVKRLVKMAENLDIR